MPFHYFRSQYSHVFTALPPCNNIVKTIIALWHTTAQIHAGGQCLSATLATSGPLDYPSEKRFLLFFAHEKGLGHMFQKSFSCSPILFFCVATSQKWFLARPPLWTAIEGVNFKDFVQRAATATMLLTEFYLAPRLQVNFVSFRSFWPWYHGKKFNSYWYVLNIWTL